VLDRIAEVTDGFTPWPGPLGGDPLGFPGYEPPDAEAVVTGEADVGGVRWCVIAGDFEVIGGSMGVAVGERVVRAYERAAAERLPVLVLATSGGARMQEGMAALVQMARTAAAAQRHADAGLVQVSHLGSPTTGGVYASFASLADIIWAEPGATVGFAGPRVVEQTTGAPLPAGAHTAESALQAGVIDGVGGLPSLRRVIDAVGWVITARPVEAAPPPPEPPARRSDIDPYGAVRGVRDPEWPHAGDVAHTALDDAVTLHGDRAGGRDHAVTAALATTKGGRAVVALVIERRERPTPTGYRLARRAVALAARLSLPVVTFVDTPGADPSAASENAGIAGEIARLMAAVATHPAPTAAVVTGEGGSGGARAFAACDRLYLMDGAVFSVIAPEGAAAILHRDASRAAEVAPLLKLTGPDLVGLGIVDGIVAHDDVAAAVDHALATAHPGDGLRRFDRASARWLREQ